MHMWVCTRACGDLKAFPKKFLPSVVSRTSRNMSGNPKGVVLETYLIDVICLICDYARSYIYKPVPQNDLGLASPPRLGASPPTI